MIKKHNVTENVEFWKNLSGLTDSFPRLDPLEVSSNDAELMHIDPKQQQNIENIIQSNGLTVIRIPKGWGATTLFRYMLYKYTKDSGVKRGLPIQFDLEDDFFLEADKLNHAIKWQIANSFLHMLNKTVLDEAYCGMVIGYEEKLDASGKTEISYNKHKILCLRNIESLKNNEDEFLKHYPFFNQPLDKIMNELLENLRVETVIFFLFGSVMDSHKMRGFVHALKQVFDNKDFKKAAKREVFFCSPTVYADLDREYARPYVVYNYPRYSSAEIFRILVKRHRPISLRTEGGREEKDGLESVFSSDFVDLVYNEKKTINGIIADVERLMEKQLDCPRSKIPYKLTPKGEE